MTPSSPSTARSAQTILVTDAETRAALAAVRSLGLAGHAVHTTTARPHALASASRHVVEEHVLPDAERDPVAWAHALDELAGRTQADWILPITELSLCALYAAKLHIRRPCLCPSPESFAAATDKHGLLEIADAIGIRAPRSQLIEEPERVEELPAGFTYPVILKARRSRFWHLGRWQSGGVIRVDDADALARAVCNPGFAGGMLVQEFIPGHGEAIFVLARDGESLVTLAHRRLREKPPTGGVSVLRESIDPDPALLEASRALIAALQFNGVAMIEFRRPPVGAPALMEINPRFWGSLQLAIDSGADFPELLRRLHTGEPVDAPTVRLGVRSRWLLGDVDHLLIALRRRSMREAVGRSRAGVCGAFLRSFADGSRLEVFRREDLRPFVREIRLRLGL